jgi:hypothetical protein
MSYSRYRSTAMPMATGTSVTAPLPTAFCRLLDAIGAKASWATTTTAAA